MSSVRRHVVDDLGDTPKPRLAELPEQKEMPSEPSTR